MKAKRLFVHYREIDVMNKRGPIIIIEDNADHREVLSRVFRQLDYLNEILFFINGAKALDYLSDESVHPFIILSDINLPELNGFELRKMIHTNEGLSSKCIPYVFFSTTVDEQAVYAAYTLSVQGFFLRPKTFIDMVNTIRKIVDYWQECYSPNHFLNKS